MSIKVLSGSLWNEIEPLLSRVERPSRYLGCEWNAPSVGSEGIRVVLAYPDIYEMGVSNLGLAILAEVVNAIEGASAERVFSPWVDMENEMRVEGVPLFSLETHRPVADADIFGISIPHELSYTNILNLLDLAGLPVRSDDRAGGPLVIGGGCGTANPEPLAPFFDLFVLGEGEEVLGRLVEVVARGRREEMNREEVLREAGRLRGVYRPSCYEVEYLDDGRLASIRPVAGAGGCVRKNVVDMDRWLLPARPVIPFCEPAHDRINVELFRGCSRGCRFCQAGMIYRPVRERSLDNVVRMVAELSERSGLEEVSLSSLSSTDYTMIEQAAGSVVEMCSKSHMFLSLPSLRMEGFPVDLAPGLLRGGRGSVTFAPEAGTERLRRVINKPLGEREMADALLAAAGEGRRRIKLYFMIGLPTETDEDVAAIGRLVFALRDLVRAAGLPPPGFNISVSTFVPKPHTPFQWTRQESLDSIDRKQGILRDSLRAKSVKLSWHDREMSMVESLLARGDRRLAPVVELAWAAGARFDSWSERFDFDLWRDSLARAGLEADSYLYRERERDEVFPWDHLSFGVEKQFLYDEYTRALAGEISPDCRAGSCLGCGVCTALDTELDLKGTWRG